MVEKMRLRLLVVGSSWPPETFLGRLMRGLSASGIDVTIAVARKPDRKWFFRSRLRALRAPAWDGPRLLRLLRLAWLALRAVVRAPRSLGVFWRQARREETVAGKLQMMNRLLPFAGVSCEVLYFPWNSAAIDHVSLFDLGKPVLVSCRGSQIDVAPHDLRRKIREGLPVMFARAAAVHCVSEAIEDEASQFGLDRRRSYVIHPGVDPEFFSPPSRRERSECLRVVTVGSLVWVKGTTYAIQAVRHAVDAGVPVQFSIIGDGPERQRVLYTIHDLGLQDHVRLLGGQTPVEVLDELRQSGVFVLPSLSEGFCNAVIEAMACELPVVITNSCGAREGVTDGLEGFIVPVRDPAAMASALIRLAADPELRRRMGREGRARVLRQFTLSRHVEKFVALLEEMSRCRAA
ncbi:MAG: glycosyltransferase family 4 protein, partial [Thermoanaerobaculia bacterium]